MEKKRIVDKIEEGKTALGLELGSTRIKAVLIDKEGIPLASGSFQWENKLVGDLWTYHLDDVWEGVSGCYQSLKEDVWQQYGVKLEKIGGITISAMMHGYLVFDEDDELLVPFRTWRNTMTGEASRLLATHFSFNIPQRWSVAHLYQAMLNKEPHVKDISFITTLAGYVHWQLTGKKNIGIGDASGMFPIDSSKLNYNLSMLNKFDDIGKKMGMPWKIKEILPQILTAGHSAGKLTAIGAKKLDPTGDLEAGIPFYPAEGDAGTGMVSTNSILARTGNVSAGTSIFAMVVLEEPLKKVHEEIDLVTTPTGMPVAMVHCNNCTSDINQWASMLMEFAHIIGKEISEGELFEILFTEGLKGEPDAGELLAYNYLSGEHTTGFEQGRPIFIRKPDSRFTFSNFMRTHLYTALTTLTIGMDILLKEEKAKLEQLLGHGGFFKTEKVGQQMLADAVNVPVSVMETAGEGGAWGAALLAGYGIWKDKEESLEEYLNQQIFQSMNSMTLQPVAENVKGFEGYKNRFVNGFPIERAGISFLNE